MIDSDFRTGNKCYPEVFFEECKYVVKEKKILKYMTDDLETSFYEEYCDEECSDKENSEIYNNFF